MSAKYVLEGRELSDAQVESLARTVLEGDGHRVEKTDDGRYRVTLPGRGLLQVSVDGALRELLTLEELLGAAQLEAEGLPD